MRRGNPRRFRGDSNSSDRNGPRRSNVDLFERATQPQEERVGFGNDPERSRRGANGGQRPFRNFSQPRNQQNIDNAFNGGARPRPPQHETTRVKGSEFKRTFPMGYRALVELENKSASEILFTLNNSRSGFHELISQGVLENDKLVLCLKLISKACESNQDSTKAEMLQLIIMTTQFTIVCWSSFLIGLQASGLGIVAHVRAVVFLVDIIETMQKVHPNSSLGTTLNIIPQLKETVKIIAERGNDNFRLVERVEKLDLIKNQLREKFSLIVTAPKKASDEPPNSFRDIPIFPDKADILDKRPFLRPNVVNGRYINAEHYLDVQFRLLREDFVRPLREGIAEYLEHIRKNAGNRIRLQDIRVYSNVVLNKLLITDDGVVHEVKFDVTHLQGIKWDQNKRLIFGALICLSSNNFETMYFGTVAVRDAEKLSEGLVCIRFENHEELLGQEKEDFVMIETEAYFEAYRHVLIALHGIDESNFPLKEYIVEVVKETKPPEYVTDKTVYCFTGIDKKIDTTNEEKLERSRKILNMDILEGVFGRMNRLMKEDTNNTTNCGCGLYVRSTPVVLLDESSWPSAEQLHLDVSQRAALKSALTQKISIIQGPPGTGKTFVGLKIIQALIHNKRCWIGEEAEKTPILVVCYTNHALDQFLEGVLKFTNNIVRIGGRSTCEALEPFNMRNLKRTFHRDHELRQENYMGRHFRQMKDIVETLLQTIKTKERSLNSAKGNILSEIDLLDEIGVERVQSLHNDAPGFLRLTGKDEGNVLLYWLGQALPPQVRGFHGERDLIVEESPNAEQFIAFEKYDDDNDEEDSGSEKEVNFDSNDEDDENGIAGAVAAKPQPFQPRALPNRNENRDNVNNNNAVYEIPPEQNNLEVLVAKGYNESESGNEYDDIDFFRDQRTELGEYGNALVIELAEPEEPLEPHRRVGNVSKNDWKTQGGKKQERKFLTNQLKKANIMTDEELEIKRNLWTINIEDRWRLYKTWIDRFCNKTQEDVKNLKEDYEKKLIMFGEVKNQEEVIIAAKALVVGMTTTGAAKHRHLVGGIQPKIVIVEEAAEVLEAHIVTSLSKNTQHLILIGDHQQLRPNPTVYDLAKRFNLEISLFERLIKNDLPFSRLGIQHRMKPCISKLLVPHIYAELEDHPSVSEYEDIKGFDKSMFFIKHSELELQADDQKSKVNMHEAQFLVSLCRYILQQGYAPDQITILTTYLGQMFIIKRLMSGILKEVRVQVVDNYQGEENDIILLSFVRSNEQGNIGFLKTENRVCVALSRAKKALFCVGNFDIMTQNSKLWENITEELTKGDAIGPELCLKCQNHGNQTLVSSSFDFDRIPEGGCAEPCDFRLLCGHVCPHLCHPLKQDHLDISCRKPCEKIICELKHRCPKLCYAICGKCVVRVTKIVPVCQHEVMYECHVKLEDIICPIKCPKMLNCGHNCKKICGVDCGKCEERVNVTSPCGHEVIIKCQYSSDETEALKRCRRRCEKILSCSHRCPDLCCDPCERKCKQIVTVLLPCQHQLKTSCYLSRDLESLMQKCPAPCQTELECEHRCTGTCGECFQGRLHKQCTSPCNKTLVCGHTCRSNCASNCPPCSFLCENRCSHSRCQQMCGYPCVPCLELCRWRCKHHECSRKCGETCNRPPCNFYCRKKLKCKHPCIGLCGEPCPTLCRFCNRDEVTQIFFGYEDQRIARFIQLEDCGHVFEVRGLTKWFENVSGGEGEIQVLRCPICRKVIRRNLRFNSYVKNSLTKIELVKAKFFGQTDINLIKKDELITKMNTTMTIQRLITLDLPVWYEALKLINQSINKMQYIEQNSLVLFENYINCMVVLREVTLTINEFISEANVGQVMKPNGEKVEKYFTITSQRLLNFLRNAMVRGSGQQVLDIAAEVERLQLLANFFKNFGKESLAVKEEALKIFNKAINTLLSCRPLTTNDKTDIEVSIKILKTMMDGAVLGITDEEKISIRTAMGLTQGHWFQCPNGHVYCITECGGAMIESKCNECGAAIGGASHALREDNRVATAMDGARHGAWTQAANLGNYGNFE